MATFTRRVCKNVWFYIQVGKMKMIFEIEAMAMEVLRKQFVF